MNYVLYVLCIVVICTFRTTDALGAAYGATPHVSIALKSADEHAACGPRSCIVFSMCGVVQKLQRLYVVRAEMRLCWCQAWQCWQTCC